VNCFDVPSIAYQGLCVLGLMILQMKSRTWRPTHQAARMAKSADSPVTNLLHLI
jgi:hypothetical protein